MRLHFSDGSTYQVAHQYLIAPYKSKYLKYDATFVSEDRTISAPIKEVCDQCNSKYRDRPGGGIFISDNTELNRKLERPGRVCIICYYSTYYEAGHSIPPPLLPYF